MCVKILLYSAILFTSKFTDHAAKCPYDEIPSIFKQGNPGGVARGLVVISSVSVCVQLTVGR